MRVGFGTDLHRTVAGDHITLGGIRISAPFAVEAVSDGDVLLHAVTDAILGALGAGDIGEMFPDSAPENHGRASGEFVTAAVSAARRKNFRIGNLDCIVNVEKPKLSPYKKKIAENLARLLNTAPENINVKAKTAEHLGAIGEGQALSAEAVVLLEPITANQ